MRYFFLLNLIVISSNLFSQRLYPFPQDGKWGYINNTGKVVVQPIYNSAEQFIEGLAKVAKRNDRDEYLFGFIDISGRETIPPKFTTVSDFDGGVARVKIRGSYFYLLQNGTVLTRNPFDEIYAATNGISLFKQDDKYGYADTNGVVLIAPTFTSAYNFSDTLLAIVSTNEGRRKRYGVVNEQGEFVIPPKYTTIKSFVNGFSAIRNRRSWQIIDSKGILVSDKKFENVGGFSDGLINVKLRGLWGYINSAGEMIIEPQYQFADQFSKGLAIVRNKNLYGYINTSGDLVAPYKFTRTTRFDGKLARVSQGRKNGFMNSVGRFNLTDKIASIGPFHYGRARMRAGNYYGYYSADGKLAVKPTFLYASNFKDELAITMTPIAGGYKVAYINLYGTEVKSWLVLSKPILKNKDVFYSLIYPSVPFYKGSDPNSRIIIRANYGDSFIKSYQRTATPIIGHGLNGLLYAAKYYSRPGYIFSEVVSLYSPPKIGMGISSYFRDIIGVISETSSPTIFKGPMNTVFFNGATLNRTISRTMVEDKYFIPFMKVSESLFLFVAALGNPTAEYPENSGTLPNYLSSPNSIRFSGRKDSDDTPVSYILSFKRSRLSVTEDKFGINVTYSYPIPKVLGQFDKKEPIFIVDDKNLKELIEPIITNELLKQTIVTNAPSQTDMIIEQVDTTNSIDLTDAIIQDAISNNPPTMISNTIAPVPINPTLVEIIQ